MLRPVKPVYVGGLLFSALCFYGAWQCSLWVLAWVAWVPLFVVTENSSFSKAALSFGAVGLMVYLALLSWLIPTSVAGWLLLSLYMSCYFAVFGAMAVHGREHILVLSWAWVFLEKIRGMGALGLPWLLLGDSQSSQLYLRQNADWLGSEGLSLVIVLFNGSVFLFFMRKSLRARLWLGVLCGVVLGLGLYGFAKTQPSAKSTHREVLPLRVAAIGTNISLQMKWDPAQLNAILKHYEDLSAQVIAAQPLDKPIDMVVWPETAIPEFVRYVPGLFQRLADNSAAWKALLLVGGLDRESTDGVKQYTNTAFLITPRKTIAQKYDKIKVVPFGEYLPLSSCLDFLRHRVVGYADFVPGYEQTMFRLGLVKWGTLICYEDIFSDFVGAYVRNGADVLIDISNDAWFSQSQIDQRLKMDVMRTVEYRRSLLRVANVGRSCWIDEWGTVRESCDNAGFFVVDVWPLEQGLTPYARWGRYGFWVLTLFVFSSIVRRSYRRKAE